jgi:hypothetical protein
MRGPPCGVVAVDEEPGCPASSSLSNAFVSSTMGGDGGAEDVGEAYVLGISVGIFR